MKQKITKHKFLMRISSVLLLTSCFLLNSCAYSYNNNNNLLVKSKENKQDVKGDNKEETPKKTEKIDESQFKPVLLGVLLEKPENFIREKIRFRGKFSSFTTLALDYEPALRKSKDYLSICIFRSDSKIPLSELKLAYPMKDAMDNQLIKDLEEGDLLEINGEVFSAALGEPWVDIVSFKILDKTHKNEVAEEKDSNEKQKNTKKNKTKETTPEED